VDRNKPSQGAVIRSFYIIGKETGRQLSHSPVIGEAFTTNPFAAAWLIAAVAVLHVFF